MRISRKLKLFDVDLYGLVAITAISGLVFFFIIKPLNDKHQAIVQTQEVSHQDIERAESEFERLTMALKNQEELANSLAEAKDALLKNVGIEDVIRNVEFLAENNNLVLEEVSPEDEQDYAQYHRNILSVFLEGTFPDFRSFLADLNKKLPYARIDELSMSVEKTSDTGLCKVHLNLAIFSPTQVF